MSESIQPKYTPEQIIAKLQAHPKFGSQIKPITKHQSAIISSGLEPAVVIAGAGSGKTETMSNRVLYLVANGYATPDQILGLTFTRKAAGEHQFVSASACVSYRSCQSSSTSLQIAQRLLRIILMPENY